MRKTKNAAPAAQAGITVTPQYTTSDGVSFTDEQLAKEHQARHVLGTRAKQLLDVLGIDTAKLDVQELGSKASVAGDYLAATATAHSEHAPVLAVSAPKRGRVAKARGTSKRGPKPAAEPVAVGAPKAKRGRKPAVKAAAVEPAKPKSGRGRGRPPGGGKKAAAPTTPAVVTPTAPAGGPPPPPPPAAPIAPPPPPPVG